MTKLISTLLMLGGLAVFAAGCGGGSRNSAYVGSKGEYAAAISTICNAAKNEAKSIELNTMEQVAENGDDAQSLVRETADKIDALEPPAEVKDASESFVDGLREEAKEIGDLTEAAKDKDEDKFRVAQEEISSIDAETSEDARFIGSDACARG